MSAQSNLPAERSFLGRMITWPERVADWADKLDPDDFYDPAHAEYWRGLVHAAKQGAPGDRALLLEFWKSRGTLALIVERAPDSSFMDEDENGLPTPEYARIIRDHAARRRRSAIHFAMAQETISTAEGEKRLAALAAKHGAAPSTQGGWQPAIQSARDLMGKELPPVRWVVEGIISEGVTLLAAKAKKGKSTLMLHVALSVAQGAPALGKVSTERAGVLYLALEDNERRMQRRIRGMLGAGETVPDGLHIAYQWLPLEMGGSVALESYLDVHPETHLVIVDTLHHVRGPSRGNGYGYAEDYAACRELLHIAGERRVAIVVITHLRKAPAEDPFDEINATGGLLAGVDNALVMRPAGRDGLMEMHRRGRDFEDDSTLALQGDKTTLRWSFAGQAETVLRSAERQAIIEVLPRDGAAEGMRPIEIADALGKPVGTIRKLLFSLMHEGEPAITRDDRGGYYAIGNAGNAGNGNACSGEESAQEADWPEPYAVTDGVTALPLPVEAGNGHRPGIHAIPGAPVTAVTTVTGDSSACPTCGEGAAIVRDGDGQLRCRTCWELIA